MYVQVRSLMFEQQRFELTDPLYTHPLWGQLREKIKGTGGRRGDRRSERKALMQGTAAAAAAAAIPGGAAAATTGARGHHQLALTGGPQGAPPDARHVKKSGKRDRIGRVFSLCSPSWMLRARGE